MKKFYGDEYKKNKLTILIDLTTICNQHCYYCYARYDFKSMWNRYMSDSILSKIYSLITNSKYNFDIVLKGGEPTLHPKFEKIVKNLASFKNVLSIEVFSNGKRKVKDLPKTVYLFTYHSTESDGHYIIENIKHLKTPSDIAIMLVPNQRENIVNFYNAVKNLNVADIDLLEIVDPKTKRTIECDDYLGIGIESTKKYFYNRWLSLSEVLSNNLNSFKGWSCHITDIEIKINGLIHIPACIQKDYSLNDYQCSEVINICKKDKCSNPCYMGFLKTKE